jgi:hypothetical protein
MCSLLLAASFVGQGQMFAIYEDVFFSLLARGLTREIEISIYCCSGLVNQPRFEKPGCAEGATADASAAAESCPGGHCLRQTKTSQRPGGRGRRWMAQTKSMVSYGFIMTLVFFLNFNPNHLLMLTFLV